MWLLAGCWVGPAASIARDRLCSVPRTQLLYILWLAGGACVYVCVRMWVLWLPCCIQHLCIRSGACTLHSTNLSLAACTSSTARALPGTCGRTLRRGAWQGRRRGRGGGRGVVGGLVGGTKAHGSWLAVRWPRGGWLERPLVEVVAAVVGRLPWLYIIAASAPADCAGMMLACCTSIEWLWWPSFHQKCSVQCGGHGCVLVVMRCMPPPICTSLLLQRQAGPLPNTASMASRYSYSIWPHWTTFGHIGRHLAAQETFRTLLSCVCCYCNALFCAAVSVRTHMYHRCFLYLLTKDHPCVVCMLWLQNTRVSYC